MEVCLRIGNLKSKIKNRRGMKHIVGLLAFVLTLTAAGEVAQAQQPAKTPRIGFLFVGSKDQPHLESFRRGLRDWATADDRDQTSTVRDRKSTTASDD
jgi:hypothetical protein